MWLQPSISILSGINVLLNNVKKITLSFLSNLKTWANIWTALSWVKSQKSCCTILKVNSGGEPDLVISGCSSQGNQKTDTVILLCLSPEGVSQRCGLLVMARNPFSETSRTKDVIFTINRLSKSRNPSYCWPSEIHYTLQLKINWKLSLITHLGLGITVFRFWFSA